MDSFLDLTPGWTDFQFEIGPTDELLDVTSMPWELLWPSSESPPSGSQSSISTPANSPSSCVHKQKLDVHSTELVRGGALQDREEYRRKQNRISQRNYRERQKHRIEELEKQAEGLRAYCRVLETQNRKLSQDHDETWNRLLMDEQCDLEGGKESSRQESIEWMLKHAYEIPEAAENGMWSVFPLN